MSIATQHAYRFGYLKSEQWSNVRLEALAREKGHCQICGDESISNDAHHIWYPENIYETKSEHLAILCRSCHDFVHAVLPECKTRDEEKGKGEWIKLRNAVIAWRLEKSGLFKHAYKSPATPESIRDSLNRLKSLSINANSSQKKKIGLAVRELKELIDGLFFRKE